VKFSSKELKKTVVFERVSEFVVSGQQGTGGEGET